MCIFHLSQKPQRNVINMMSDLKNKVDTIFYQQSFDAVNEFFSCFVSDSEIIEWMRKRRRSSTVVSETAGDNDIIAVIPGNNSVLNMETPKMGDFFSGFRKIYTGTVDGKPDFSRCVNDGIKTALKHDPGWIVVSSPGIQISGNNHELRNSLKSKDNEDNRILIPGSSRSLSGYIRIGRRNVISGKLKVNQLERWALQIENNLSAKYGDIYIAEHMDLIHKAINRGIFNVVNASSFVILSGKWLKSMNGRIMDEAFTSSYCGVDFSIRHAGNTRSVNFINLQYKVKRQKVPQLSLQFDQVWDLCNRIYLTHKINNAYYSH